MRLEPAAGALAAEARALGFRLVGAAPRGPLRRGEFVTGWLAEGRAGEMGWLSRRAAERLEPRRAFPWARSLIAVAHPYPAPPPPPADWRVTLRGRVAAYARGADYHGWLLRLLDRLAERLGRTYPGARFLAYVDTGPLVERAWAAQAGLGWIGRNTLLLHPDVGSWTLLGELVTDLEVTLGPPAADRCGTCTRCVAACPTGALEAGYTMDPRRCISYLTIEHRSAIPPAFRPALENWVFGCDLCQEVCPWNEPVHGPFDDLLTPHLPALLALDADAFDRRYGRTSVARTRRRGLLRNAAVALGNTGNPAAVPPLVAALADPEPLVRSHAAWALGRLGTQRARGALDRARKTEPDASVRNEITTALTTGDARQRGA
jgi:epoxyqueuosine reductase